MSKYTYISIEDFDIGFKIDELLHQMMSRLPQAGNSSDLRIKIPLYMLDNFKKQLHDKVKAMYFPGDVILFRGIKVELGYENKIILFHVGYPMTQDDRMKVEFQIP